MTSGIYDGQRANLAALNGESIVVLLMEPGYSFDPTHEFLADVAADEIGDAGYTRFSTTATVSFSGGRHRVLFDTVPEFDTSAVSNVGGWIVAIDSGSDATAALVMYEADDNGASPSNPYRILAPEGFAQVAADPTEITVNTYSSPQPTPFAIGTFDNDLPLFADPATDCVRYTLTANVLTFAAPSGDHPGVTTVILEQDSTGGWVVDSDADTDGTAQILWATAAPSIDTTPGHVAVLRFSQLTNDGLTWLGEVLSEDLV